MKKAMSPIDDCQFYSLSPVDLYINVVAAEFEKKEGKALDAICIAEKRCLELCAKE
jgi:hypothetical protein